MGRLSCLRQTTSLDCIPVKRSRQRNQFFRQGECQRLVLEIFRDAEEPLSVRRITEALLQRKGLDVTPAMIEQMSKNARGVVMRLAGKNVVQSAGADDTGKTWKVC